MFKNHLLLAMKLTSSLLFGLISLPLLAVNSTQIILTDNTYLVATGSIESFLDDENLAKIKDVEERKLYLASKAKNEVFDVEMAYSDAIGEDRYKDREKFNQDLEAFKERFPQILKDHLKQVLGKFPHRVETKAGAEIVTIDQGVEFWIELISATDPQKRDAGQVLLSHRYADEYAGFAGSFVKALVGEFKRLTRIIKTDLLSELEWKAVISVARNEGFAMSRHGDYIVLGTGQSFLLADGIFEDAEKLNDPILKKQFSRVTEFLASKGIDIEIAEHQGAAAFYSPLENKMAYVMPSRSDLDTHSHEATHARYNKFEETYRAWTTKRNLAVPYEVDGPALGFGLGFGGFMNLLNELNSWRIGTSFSGPMTDRQILRLLKNSYGRQAGKKAAEAFGQIWTAERVNGQSVPRMILQATRAFNQMSESEALSYGQNALINKAEIEQINFIRLAVVRYKESTLPPAWENVLGELERVGATDTVRAQSKWALERSKTAVPSAESAEQKTAYKELKKNAEKWQEALVNEKIKVIPLSYKYSYITALYFAVSQNISDYNTVIQELQKRFGEKTANFDESERAVFKEILNEQEGESFDQKFMNHLARLNNRGFQWLWSEFIKKPTYDLSDLLIEHHLAEFSSNHIKKMLGVVLDQKRSQDDQEYALKLLTEVFEKLGFETLYDVSDYPSMIRTQKSMNKKNGLPLDAHLPVRRKPQPQHWLFNSSIDEFLAARMFDGRPGVYRLDLINFLTTHTFPEELPNLTKKVIEAIVADTGEVNKNDLWVARMFLVPKESFIYSTQIVWQHLIAQAVLNDSTPSEVALEFLAEYYRLAVSPVLPSNSAKLNSKDQLNEAVRRESREDMQEASARERRFVERAGIDLWKLLAHQSQRVRRAARYALATHPAYLLEVQDKILSALHADDSKYRQEAIQLVSFTRPGFLPKVDRFLKSQRFTHRPGEERLLSLRLPPSEAMLGFQEVSDDSVAPSCKKIISK
jgi:hypothetical protein